MPDSSAGRAGMSIQHISMHKHNVQKKSGAVPMGAQSRFFETFYAI